MFEVSFIVYLRFYYVFFWMKFRQHHTVMESYDTFFDTNKIETCVNGFSDIKMLYCTFNLY